MKKIENLIIFTIMLLLPTKIFALDSTIDLTCAKNGLNTSTTTHCTVTGTLNSSSTGYELMITFPSDVEVSSFSTPSYWIGLGDPEEITTGTILSRLNTSGKTGEVIYGEFDVKLKSGASSASQEVSVTLLRLYGPLPDVTQYDINKSDSVTFSDYLELTTYLKNSTMIYNISGPVTLTSFLQNVDTNATVAVLNGNNSIQSTDILKTGYTFRTTFTSGTINYKVCIIGDTLGEGRITKNGAAAVARHIIDGNVLTGAEFLKAADYNNDSSIKMNDALRMLGQIQD